MDVASGEYNFSCMTSAIIDFEATKQSGRVQFNVSPSLSQSNSHNLTHCKKLCCKMEVSMTFLH